MHSSKHEIDPSKLRGLDQAISILELLCSGEDKREIVLRMHGDRQLVDMWMNFLQHNHWIAHDLTSHGWVLTEKGEQWVSSLSKVAPQQ